MTEPARFRTMCPMNCHPTLCGMVVDRHADGSVAIAGDPDHPDSRGYLCMRGHAAHQIVGNDRRLLAPLARGRRGAPDWSETTWDDSLDRIAAAIRAVGPQAVGLWQGHGNAVNDYGVGVKRGQFQRFANIGGFQYWNPAMICWGLGGFGLGLTGTVETSTKEDMGAQSNLILLWGANSVSQANTMPHVDAARRRGARVVTIDVRRTEAGALSDEALIIRPGSDAALALAMMHVILDEGLEDRAFIEAHTLGIEALRADLADKTPRWAEARTGVAADRIAALARDWAATRPGMIVLGGSSIHKGDNGWAAARAISCLPALTGDYGRPGGGLGPRHGARSHGAGFADISAPERRPPGDYIPNQMEAIVAAMEAGRIRVLLTLGSNILSSFPDTGRLRAALDRLDLIVAYDIFPNQTTREVVDIVLPGTIWLEEVGVKATNTHVHLCDRVLPPAGAARPLYSLYRGLADRLGLPDVYPWPDQEAAIDAVLDHPATGRATVADLRADGGRVALAISHTAYPTRAFDTPSGRIEFWSDRARAMGLPPLPHAPDPAPVEDGTLVLAQGRTFAHFHSFYDHARALPALARREDAPELWIAPADAAARGIGDGSPVEVSNHGGTFAARARVTPRMGPGAVWMRDGWPGFNALTDGAAVLPEAALDAFAFSVGQSGFGARVRVVPASAG